MLLIYWQNPVPAEVLTVAAEWLTPTFPDVVERIESNLQYYREVYNAKKLASQIVGVTGEGPLESIEVRQLVEKNGGFATGSDIWQADQIVVIGREQFDKEYLRESIRVGLNCGFTCAFMSQEAFNNILQRDEYPVYHHRDPRIREHPGLSFLASIGFKWPSTDAFAGGHGEPGAVGWNETSTLKALYGYNVDRNTPVSVRQLALNRAIRPDALGLRRVAEFIAWLIRLNKQRHDDLHQAAIDRWEDDLNRLRVSYYENSIHRFIWPSS
jgi:hypothetical protein